MQAVAALDILALGYLAVENWMFGFERQDWPEGRRRRLCMSN
jgi:hypothetical protein